MDPLLALIIALLAFAVFVLLLDRAFKFVMVIGCALIVYLALMFLGVIG